MDNKYKSTMLMMKDKPVLRFNLTSGVYDILDEELLPQPMKGKFRPVIAFKYCAPHSRDFSHELVDETKSLD